MLRELIRVPVVPRQKELDRMIATHVSNYMEVKDEIDEEDKQLIECSVHNRIVTGEAIR